MALVASIAAGDPATAADAIRVRWASSAEADLAGYRLRYGTAAGTYTQVVEAGLAAMAEIAGLRADTTYYLAVYAYDEAGNESAPSPEVTVRVPSSLSPIPRVDTAFEMGTRSIYAVRGRQTLMLVAGGAFQPGATCGLGPEIAVGNERVTAAGDLLATVDVGLSATLGGRTLTVTNPDGGTGSRSDTLTIVKSPDFNRDCSVDIMDLNALARAWNETGGETRYVPDIDMDGDGYVGPDDLSIFVQYFGRRFSGCP